MRTKQLTHAEAVIDYCWTTGMSRENMERSGIIMRRCTCGQDCCSGWLAVGANLTPEGRPVR